MPQLSIVDTQAVEWENGLSVYENMAPAWREHLGPKDKVMEMLAKYNQKTLRIDPVTTRRCDLIWLAPGYIDVTHAYHGSVEECFLLEGGIKLNGEGSFEADDYFWRPPGWVHSAEAPEGALAVLSLEGTSPGDGSGAASRHIRPAEELGSNALLTGSPADVPPRGRVLHLRTGTLAWLTGEQYARGQRALDGFDIEHIAVKPLSVNQKTGAQSVLLRLGPGYRQQDPGRHTASLEFYVVSGALAIGDTPVNAGAYVFREGQSVQPPMSSDQGATLFMKVDGWLDYVMAGR